MRLRLLPVSAPAFLAKRRGVAMDGVSVDYCPKLVFEPLCALMSELRQ
jgi:hypothetical protein